jgi:ketosteroid isomerase-like protein
MKHECAALTNDYFLALQQRDVAALDRMLADDFIYIEPLMGWIVMRDTLLRDVGHGGSFDSITHSGMRISDYETPS